MAVKVYGMAGSYCTDLVLMICQELGVKYELTIVDLSKGEHKDPQWIATKQPFGAIPVLVDEDGTQLFESRAIARYLVLKYGTTSGLIPPTTDPQACGLFEQAASIEYSSFAPALGQIYREHLFAGLEGRQLNQDVLDKYKKASLINQTPIQESGTEAIGGMGRPAV